MASVVNFQGKNYIEPGSYAATVYNPTSVVNVASFGNVMIIDTGLSLNDTKEFAGGSGIKGELNSGLKSVYEFVNYENFLAFMGGGLVSDIAKKIFTPISGAAGAPKLYYARAATTVSANIVLTLSAGNSLNLKCKNEGIAGNGVIEWGNLKVGYAAKIIAGVAANTYILQVFKGTFAGVDDAGEPFGAKDISSAVPQSLVASPPLRNLQELYNWAISNKIMNAHFVISYTGEGTTAAAVVPQVLASGGTTAFLSGTEYDDVLESISELDITFFLCTNLTAAEGTDAVTNGKLFTYIKNTAKFTEFMVVPGGSDDTDLFGEASTSEAIALYYNSGQVVTVHGAPIEVRKDRNGNKKLKSIYLAATVIGLNAGLEPQTPLTFKRIGYQAFSYDLKKTEREQALQAGIMHMRNVSGYWCINQGITTLLDNKQTIASDGQSFELSIELIKAQLNKELISEGEIRFTGNTAAQATPESVKNFTETKLQSMVAEMGNDNLIISWKNVKVSAVNSDYFISYDFIPNIPVNKTFFIGNVLDFSVEV